MDTDTYTDRIRQFLHGLQAAHGGHRGGAPVRRCPRFQQAGHGEALETLLEVLELEAEDRQQRRTTRLRRASAPQAGHEQAGRRPALTLSPEDYNVKTSLALFCPIGNYLLNARGIVKLWARGK